MSIASNQAKTRWNAKKYTQVKIAIDPEIASAFKTTCNSEDISMASVLSQFMTNYSKKIKKGIVKTPPDYSTRRKRRTALKRIILELEQIKTGEEVLFYNAPENLQTAPIYEYAEQYISVLDEVIEQLESIY